MYLHVTGFNKCLIMKGPLVFDGIVKKIAPKELEHKLNRE